MIKINDLYEQTGKKSRMSLAKEPPPPPPPQVLMMPSHASTQTPTLPSWCKLSDDEISGGKGVACQLCNEFKKIASDQLAADILWKTSKNRTIKYRANITSMHCCGMMGLYYAQLGEQSRLVVTHGWIKKLGDEEEGRRALERAKVLAVLEEQESSVGCIVSKFDIV